MKSSTKHLIEALTVEMGLTGKHITIELRSKENALENRPNAFTLTRGKNGWTSCKQKSWYFCLSVGLGTRNGVLNGYWLLKDDRDGEILNGNDGTSSYHKIDYREYTDDEIIAILNDIRNRGLDKQSPYTDCYTVR